MLSSRKCGTKRAGRAGSVVLVTEITERIAARMRELKLEPIDLAAGARTSQTTVERWINHYSDPRAYKIVAIAKTLRVSVSWLLTGEEEGFDDQTRASIWEGLQGALDRLAKLRQKKMTEGVRSEIDEVEHGITLAQQLLGLTAAQVAALAEAAAATREAESLRVDAPGEDPPELEEDDPPQRPSP